MTPQNEGFKTGHDNKRKLNHEKTKHSRARSKTGYADGISRYRYCAAFAAIDAILGSGA
jgi:hypothetical protein